MQKFIKKYTEEDSELLILSQLIRYADHNKKFQRDYVDNIYDFYEKHEYITENQYKSLKHIYNTFKVYETFPLEIYD